MRSWHSWRLSSGSSTLLWSNGPCWERSWQGWSFSTRDFGGAIVRLDFGWLAAWHIDESDTQLSLSFWSAGVWQAMKRSFLDLILDCKILNSSWRMIMRYFSAKPPKIIPQDMLRTSRNPEIRAIGRDSGRVAVASKTRFCLRNTARFMIPQTKGSYRNASCNANVAFHEAAVTAPVSPNPLLS